MRRQNEYDIENILKQCKRSATNGYKIASQQADIFSNTLMDAVNKIQSTIDEFNTSPMYDSEATAVLEHQLLDIRDSFNKLSESLNDDLIKLHRSLSKFSITLFGRTMAGKSTLMEILTEGDGRSIGTGSQRTTKDVRTYTWNNLEITDVPGIGAFEGQQDESKAFEAAKKADLILFLLTDDAPQAAEAECFCRIKEMGKPILCIMNVKAEINENDLEMSLWDVEDRFDLDRLNAIKNEFLAYDTKFGQEWQRIPFVYVHLQAAFFSQRLTNKNLADEFRKISGIDYLKKRIVDQIREKGEFYRTKNFIDVVSKPALESEETLLKQSLLNSAQGRTILSKRRKLSDWKDKFYRDGLKQVDSAITGIRSQLYSEIAAFAEDHFDDEHADKAWDTLLKRLGITDRCQALLERFESQVNDNIREISREITNELKIVSLFTDDKDLRMHRIIDGKKVWNWGSLIISTGLSIGTGISYLVGAALTGPLGWAAIAATTIGIIGDWFFKSRDKQEYEARRRLEENLKKNVEKTCNTLESQMRKNFDRLIEERINKLLREMDRMNSVIFKLSDTQKELAWKINNRLLELNKQIVTEAIKFIGAEGLEWWIFEVARIPGDTVLLQLNDGKKFPEDNKIQLQRLMSEFIAFVYYSEDKRVFVSRIIGKSIERRQISVEDKIGVAHVPIPNDDPKMTKRARLAQQLTRLVITQ